MANIEALPEQVLLKVLSYIPAGELVLTCRLVCHHWKKLVDGRNVKVQHKRSLRLKKKEDQCAVYFCTSSIKNLIKNPCGEEEFAFWELTSNGGDRWKVEDLPGHFGKPFPNPEIQKYFVTSYGWCEKSQLINLISEGFEAEILDNIQPPITVRDWYAGRHDCGFEYELHVELLSEDMSKIQEYKTDKSGPQWNDSKWREVSNTSSNYGPGVR
ncbi:F-box only protein 6-like [Hemiscyllium ocellatum]|uniref:F-box only protein 6-like n=1 Tax=Hemiscyllium ocellatum TaxID=170820 RepID=UPI0029675B57|nr:F-box only protein 6-like [Hemiscyllium ocellatum]